MDNYYVFFINLDGKLKKEGEACGQSCDDDCGNCEDGLTCGPSYSPSCRCGTCKR